MTPAPAGKSSTMRFQGKSGQRYSFQAWPLGTRFKAIGAVFVFTKRTFEDRTFTTKASHQLLGIGQTASLTATLASAAEAQKIGARGANCICIYSEPNEARRAAVERDLLEGNEQSRESLHYLFHPTVPPKPPPG
jgi:hypothetical protein